MIIGSMMVMVTLPVTITRMTMLDLDCLVVNKNEMGIGRKENLHIGPVSLREEVASARRGLGSKTGLSICCGVLGIVMVSVVITAILGAIFIS